MSLVSRHLEANGIATVVIGSARDIVEECAVARFLFSDFPLGNAAGRPRDRASQEQTLALALRLLESAPAGRTTVQTPFAFGDDESWKQNYARVDPEHSEALRRAGERRRAQQQVDTADGTARKG